jgi:cysteine desulfuration protein SufE
MAIKTLSDLVESFSLFDNWEDRYRYLIDLGQRLESLSEEDRTDQRLVQGCTSRVWLSSEIITNESGAHIYRFRGDSDAQIVKGLIYILKVAYQEREINEIKSVNIEDWFEKLGLSGHLSPSRRNGFFAMVQRIHHDVAVFS